MDLGNAKEVNPSLAHHIIQQVFDQVQWPSEMTHGEDCYFNRKVYEVFPNRIVVKFPLYMYKRRNPPLTIVEPSFVVLDK